MSADFAAALSEHPDPAVAVGEAIGQVLDEIGPEPDLATLFVTTAHLDRVGDIVDAVTRILRPRCLIGAACESVIGGPKEIEERPAVSLWAGRCGPVRAVRLQTLRGADGWTVLGFDPTCAEGATLVLIADPFSFPVDAFLDRVNTESPRIPTIGGLASAAGAAGGNRLILDGEVWDDGAVGVFVHAPVRTVVSQGCRPVGEPYTVTGAEGPVIRELAGRPPLERLEQTYSRAGEHDRELMQRGLQMGVVYDEHKARYRRGDFLVRGLMGADRASGALAIGDQIELGAVVQFHVRDEDSAAEDLLELLADVEGRAALVFTCNGRGRRLFGAPDHDAAIVAGHCTGAIAGFFCAGEIGPIGGRNYLHTYTASILVFE